MRGFYGVHEVDLKPRGFKPQNTHAQIDKSVSVVCRDVQASGLSRTLLQIKEGLCNTWAPRREWILLKP